MRYDFRMDQADLEDLGGDRATPWNCPIARMVARTLGIPPAYGVLDVDKDGIFLAGQRGLRRASGPLPRVARAFIDDWHARRPVTPIAFKLAVRV